MYTIRVARRPKAKPPVSWYSSTSIPSKQYPRTRLPRITRSPPRNSSDANSELGAMTIRNRSICGSPILPRKRRRVTASRPGKRTFPEYSYSPAKPSHPLTSAATFTGFTPGGGVEAQPCRAKARLNGTAAIPKEKCRLFIHLTFPFECSTIFFIVSGSKTRAVRSRTARPPKGNTQHSAMPPVRSAPFLGWPETTRTELPTR